MSAWLVIATIEASTADCTCPCPCPCPSLLEEEEEEDAPEVVARESTIPLSRLP